MPTKAGTAYVDIVGNFAPLNRQIARMGSVSARASKSFSRSMKVVNRDTEVSHRRVVGLSREISEIGGAAQTSSRQATRAFRQIETSSARALRALRAIEAAQARVAVSAPPAVAAGGRRMGGRGGQTGTLDPTVAALIPVVSGAAVEAAAAAAARQAASRAGTIGAARGAYSTYGLARSFGRGRAASTVAEVGARASSALSLGKSFAKTFAKGLGPGLATMGVENILTSALKGDMKSAGFKAGGALVGGVLGSFAGPAGTMIGVGLGSMAGDLVGGLLSSSKKTLTLQQRLAASAKQVTFAYKGLRASSQTLARSGDALVRSHGRARKASREVAAAERQLARARKQFGPNSRQASQAEQRLSAARQRSAKASKSAQRAERLHGVERKVQQEILRGTILEERHKLNLLQKSEKQIRKELATAYKNERSHQVLIHLKGKLNKNQQELTDTQKKENDTLREATQTIGPKYAKYLKNASGELLRAGRQARTAQKDIEKPARAFKKAGDAGENSARRAKRGYDKLGRGLGAFAGGAIKNMGKASGAMRSFDDKTSQALGDVRTGTNQTLVGLGVAKINFGVAKKQTGGAIVPGSGEGDSYRTTLPVGSFVLNKKATAALGFRRGGQVPVLLEPGERTFLPHEVRRVGRPALEAANAAIPRFATGGSLTEPRLTGPEPLRRGGQAAVHKAFEGAQRYIAKHRPTGGVSATGPAPKGFKQLLKKWKPNHPRWDVWQVGLLLQKMGYHVAENPHFPPFDPGAHSPTGYHPIGRAIDVNADDWPGGEKAALDKLYAQLKRIPYSELLWQVADHYDHLHYAYRRGGPVQRLQEGGFAGDINRIFAEHNSAEGDWGGKTLPSYVVAALAEKAGEALGVDVPGRTMEQVTRGESGAHKRGSARPGATGVDPGGTKGLGLWMITTGFNDALIAKYGGEAAMRNPVRNAAAMAEIYDSQGLGAWYGTGSVSGTNIHYDGKYDLAKALGGKTFEQALGVPASGGGNEPKPIPKILKGAYERYQVIKHGDNPDELKGIETHYKVTTTQLTFGSLPKDLDECNKELRIRQREMAEYRAAIRDAKRKATKDALKANLILLEKRVAALRKLRIQLLRDKRSSRKAKKIAEAANFTHWTAPDGVFAQKEDLYTTLQEKAEQIVALEPTEPAEGANRGWIASTLEPYVTGKESPAWMGVLGVQSDWRNEILGAQSFAREKMGKWREQIDTLTEKIKAIKKLKKDHPQAWEKRKGLIPGFEEQIKALRGSITRTRDHTLGEWEESLEEMQGRGRSHEAVALPPLPSEAFGGTIFVTQETIRDLGLKVEQALAGTTDDDGKTERDELTEELIRQANQRTAVAEAQFATLRDFSATYPVGEFPPYAGKAHSGAVVPGPPSREKTMIVRGQERIRTPEQELAMAEKIRRQAGGDGAALPQLIVNGSIVQEAGDTRDPVEAVINDRRFPVAVRQVAMGGRVTPGGARS